MALTRVAARMRVAVCVPAAAHVYAAVHTHVVVRRHDERVRVMLLARVVAHMPAAAAWLLGLHMFMLGGTLM